MPETLGRVIGNPFDAGTRYSVIYADPPWYYRDRATAGLRGAGYKYPDMTNEQISALPVSDIAAENAILFLWVTWPKLPEVLPVINAWGFNYRTVAFVWVKRNLKTTRLFWGMGNWTRANTEPCLLATRGRPKRVDAGVHQVVESPLARHSQKPAEVRERIVKLTGDVSRIELFAREAAPGWDAWGNEATTGPGAALATRRAARPVVVPIQGEVFDGNSAGPTWLIEHVRQHGRITRAQAAKVLGVPVEDAKAMLYRLVRDGKLLQHGRTSGTWYGPAS